MNIHRNYYYTYSSGKQFSLSILKLIMFFFTGAHLRQKSLDPERRRQSLGTIIPHRASDAFLDPYHAAILFRDARGVSFFFLKI